MKILVTGAAGFIGYHISKALIKNNHLVVGLDNINDYYSVKLKYSRLSDLGIKDEESKKWNLKSKSKIHKNFIFYRKDLIDYDSIQTLFEEYNFDIVCHLGAQAGVRYSIENPKAYIDSNLLGFFNIIDCCRKYFIKHFVYASSSSVYGLNEKIPFSVEDQVDKPISLYAATKKSNELLAHSYSHIYSLKTTGLRFFTVYGPWGRPDMAIYLFTDAIVKQQPINIFNNGNLKRDFTYIDDIVDGVKKVVESSPNDEELYKIYNIGNNKPVNLMDFIDSIEEKIGIKSIKNYMPMQSGDVYKTWANVDALISDFGYKPSTSIDIGIEKFVKWYKNYNKIK